MFMENLSLSKSSSKQQTFIALEGTDGSGKSSLRQHLYKNLFEDITPLTVGKHCWLNPKYAQIIINLRQGWGQYAPEVVLEAFLQDKIAQTQLLLRPHLVDRPIIADRSLLSDIVYLNVLYGIPLDESIDRYFSADLELPQLIVFIQSPPALSNKRVTGRIKSRTKSAWKSKPDRWENEETIAQLSDVFASAIQALEGKIKFLKVTNSGKDLNKFLSATTKTILEKLN